MPHDNERIDAQGWSPDLDQADWIKPRWPWPEDLDGFLTAVGLLELPKADQRRTLLEISELPSFAHMPTSLKIQLAEVGLISSDANSRETPQ